MPTDRVQQSLKIAAMDRITNFVLFVKVIIDMMDDGLEILLCFVLFCDGWISTVAPTTFDIHRAHKTITTPSSHLDPFVTFCKARDSLLVKEARSKCF
jgi:hypothetical protein